jgi:hypothetical protein
MDKYVLDKFILFVSFDISGSTKYKYMHKNGHSDIAKRLIDLQGALESSSDQLLSHLHLWKSIGDELVYIRIFELDENDKIKTTIDSIAAFTVDNNEHNNVLLFKTAVWGSEIHANSNRNSNAEDPNDLIDTNKTHLYIILKDTETYTKQSTTDYINGIGRLADTGSDCIQENSGDITVKQVVASLDFIGRPMDFGFRLSKFARKKLLLFSYCIYDRLSKTNKINESNAFIHSFKELNGVMDNIPYPVIFWSAKASVNDFVSENLENFLENPEDFNDYRECVSRNNERHRVMVSLRNRYIQDDYIYC